MSSSCRLARSASTMDVLSSACQAVGFRPAASVRRKVHPAQLEGHAALAVLLAVWASLTETRLSCSCYV